VNVDYPEHLLAREAAPPWDGEGPFALWHLSEDPMLGPFRPRARAGRPGEPPLVWAVDTRHAPMFWFPRDCPRGCIWPVSTTTPEDRERFFSQSAAKRLHVMEADWLEPMRDCRLYAYRLPTDPFRPHEVGGYWVTDEPVNAIEQSGHRRSTRQARQRWHRAPPYPLDRAILAPRHQLNRRVQRLPPSQQRHSPGPPPRVA
jgi:hypothetical protein